VIAPGVYLGVGAGRRSGLPVVIAPHADRGPTGLAPAGEIVRRADRSIGPGWDGADLSEDVAPPAEHGARRLHLARVMESRAPRGPDVASARHRAHLPRGIAPPADHGPAGLHPTAMKVPRADRRVGPGRYRAHLSV